jgi:hypothetical protein
VQLDFLVSGASNYNGRPQRKLRTLQNSRSFIESHFILLKNLKFVEGIEYFFRLNIYFAAHFAAPWTLLSRAAAQPPPCYVPVSGKSKVVFLS